MATSHQSPVGITPFHRTLRNLHIYTALMVAGQNEISDNQITNQQAACAPPTTRGKGTISWGRYWPYKMHEYKMVLLRTRTQRSGRKKIRRSQSLISFETPAN